MLITALLSITSLFSINAQLLYRNNNLFIGPKPTNWSSYSSNPKIVLGQNWAIEANGSNLDIRHNESNTTKRILIDGNGRVGIGYTVNQTLSYTLQVNGTLSANGFQVSSDATLKRNITDLADTRYNYLDKVLKLSGKSYEKQISLSEKEYKQEFGFIAQEVREVLPELVQEDHDGLLSINYIGLIPLLVESLKDLKKDLAELENKINSKVAVRSADGETGNDLISVSGAVLYQNLPNPSSNGVTIAYELPKNFSSAYLYVYNMAGAQVKSYTLTGSSNEVKITANELPAGTYIYTLVVNGNKVDTKKMILTN
ncbi:MAG: tail fiber domain-containing protein [Tannerella sp.]|nr:tail fiber domain-containing protein [Tannerella sp.]